jgi:hypothetical protein
MNYYLSTTFPDLADQPPLSVRVNNLEVKKKKQPAIVPSFVNEPDEQEIQRLNELASKPPFSNIHRSKRHDPL